MGGPYNARLSLSLKRVENPSLEYHRRRRERDGYASARRLKEVSERLASEASSRATVAFHPW